MDDQQPITLSDPDAQRARHRLACAGGGGRGVLHAKGQISVSAAVVAPGLTVMAVILLMGAVSGAHLNPVVSIAFALRRDFSWYRVPWYLLAQLVGATLAGLFLLAVFGNVEHLGAALPGPGYDAWQALLLEIVLTGGLVSVILGTASRRGDSPGSRRWRFHGVGGCIRDARAFLERYRGSSPPWPWGRKCMEASAGLARRFPIWRICS